MSLDMSQFIDTRIYYEGTFEAQTVFAIRRLIKPGMVCVDVGANIGWISLQMARAAGEGGVVYAFEPSQWTFSRLQVNVSINDYDIRCYRLAIGERSALNTSLTLPQGYRLDGKCTAETQVVDTVNIDDFFQANPTSRLDFFKTDTDGHEPYVLKGAMRTLQKFKPVILFELAPWHLNRAGTSAGELFEILSRMGYRFLDESLVKTTADAVLRGLSKARTANVIALPGHTHFSPRMSYNVSSHSTR